MPLAPEQVESLKESLAKGGKSELLDSLAKRLREEGKYHELFEVLKMLSRQRLGLPIVHFPDEEIEDPQLREKLEDALFEVCREVGTLFMKSGQIQESWVYLRPVGDTKLVQEMLKDVEVTDENVDTLIGILLSEGVDPKRGFEIVLERYGTCNAITTFDSEMPRRSIADQQAAASLLVRHLYAELKDNLAHDIARRSQADVEGAGEQAPGDESTGSESDDENDGAESPEVTALKEQSISELLSDRSFLLDDHTYHIDTTHLASVVRFAKLLNDEGDLQLALELTHYGKGLSDQYQYEGDEPFTDVYPDHERFFNVLLDNDVEGGLEFFRAKAEQVDAYTQGTMSAEVYVDLLCRTGRHEEALAASIEHLKGRPTMGIAPSLLEICRQANRYESLLDYCQSQDDLLGYGTGLILAEEEAAKK